MDAVQTIDRGDGVGLAYRHRTGATPTFVFLPGYMSDMAGAKAQAVDDWAARRGFACLRLDYSGCGASEGAFDDGTISRWRDDALAVIDHVAPGPAALVGSSMGGWIALLVALARPDRVAGVVTIAGAPDFTAWGMDLTADDHASLGRRGFVERESAYGAPYRYTAGLIADGASNALLGGEIAIDAPVRLLHGQRDREVPWRLSLDVADRLHSSDVQAILIKDGDHRLSRPADLALLCATLDQLMEI